MATGRKGALSLLQNYYFADDSDDDSGYTSEDDKKRKQEFNNTQERKRQKVKRTEEDDEESMVVDVAQAPNYPNTSGESSYAHSFSSRKASTTVDTASAIPLPPELNYAKDEHHIDDSSEHQGRSRSFAHERGNWASLLYVPLHLGVYGPSFASLLASLVTTCQDHNVELTKSTDLHISLTKTLVLQLHWIQPLTNDLRARLGKFSKFSLWLHGLSVYVNEEKTRTFLGLRVCHGRAEIEEIVSQVDLCISEYRLPSFYKDGSYHVSIAWCVGDISEDLRRLLPILENVCSQYFAVESDMRTFDVSRLIFKTGNKLHNITLDSGI